MTRHLYRYICRERGSRLPSWPVEARQGPSVLDARRLGDAMVAYEQVLRAHREVLNRLNVYPVPDGDTGTNMGLTVEAVLTALAEALGVERSELGADGANGAAPDTAGSAEQMSVVCKAISHGSLMGARGNSGVILCQILRGMVTPFAGEARVDASLMASALGVASDAARAGVMRPVEGTILTVAAGAAAAAAAAASAGEDLPGVLAKARLGAVEALHRTPDLLPVLAAAGVVDAGGAGLTLLYDALLYVVADVPLPEELPLPPAVKELVAGGRAGVAGLPPPPSAAREAGEGEGGVGDLRYEVMYMLEAPDRAIPAFKEVWAGVGDSIVVVGGDGLWNCHIHTDDIGASIEAALDAGRPRDIRVTDLAEQVEEEMWVRSAGDMEPPPAPDGSGVVPVTSVVAVGTGPGIRRIFHSLGVHHVVAGGQSMNPSTAQILELVEATPSDQVIVLPNNKNIYPVANQVGALTTKHVRVVETPGIQEGFAALIEYDPESGADENAVAMSAAAERVLAGEVTRAVRAASSPAGPIEEGDWIGLRRSGIVSVAGSPGEATIRLLERIVEDGHEIVTIIDGEGASAAETRRITEWLRANHPEVSVERHHGGQPLYPYLVSVE
jgi:DAK2 domain fusion protein YloV